MKSKSPFAMKSPLLAYKSDMTGNYANPEYVPRVNVGAAVGAHVAKTAADVFSSINEADKAKQKAATDKASGGSNDNRQTVNVYGSNGGSGSNVHKGSDTDITTTTKNILGSNQGNTGNSYAKSYSGLSKDEGGNAKATGDFKGGNLTDWTNYVKDYNSKKNSTTETTRNEVKTTWTMNDKGEKIDGPVTMKGSPVKHNAGAVGSIGNADPLAGGIAGIGQQISNQAQQRAAKLYTSRASNGPTVEAAGGMIGVTGSIGQDVLPPPNQVAETGSYGGSGDRMLEMDSNPVGNQSIGRNTDVASQLFGSGQRASMLAMKGTPLAHKTAAKHPEPHRKTKTFGGKLKPGDPYIVADNVDEGGSNPPDTLNLKKYKQPNYMSNPGDQYKKDQFPDEDIFSQNKDQLNKEGFNTDSTSSVRIFKN